MTCRRCGGARNVAHYRNDFFDGWLCVACVDALVNEVSDAYVGLPTKREPVLAAGAHFGRTEPPEAP